MHPPIQRFSSPTVKPFDPLTGPLISSWYAPGSVLFEDGQGHE